MRRPSDLQIYYQRNLFCGLLSSVVLSIVAGILISGIGGSDSRSHLLGYGASSVATDFKQTAVTDNENQRNLQNLHPYFRKHEGFLGFVQLQAVGQNLPVPDAGPSDSWTIELDPEISLENEAELWILSGGTGEFVSSSGDYYKLGASNKRKPFALADRDVEVVWRLDPDYPFVAKDVGKEGEVTVLVFIDTLGELSTFPDWIDDEGIKTLEYHVNGERKMFHYALKEEPTGWFFAQSFLKVLPKWSFTPKIESGNSVSSLLRIRFSFCMGLNCLRLELEQVRR